MTASAAAPSPLLPPDDPPSVRRARIARGIARELFWFLLITVFAPVVLAGAAAVDLMLWLRSRKPWMAVRMVAIVWWFHVGELRGLLGIAGVWLTTGGPFSRDTPARRRRTYALQVRWATGHLDGVSRICKVRFVVEGNDLVGRGPMLVFPRHASVLDNGLPASVVSRAHGIDLRYALKDELQRLPTLDAGARWVPTCFVHRSSDDPAREIARVRSLAAGLHGERDGVLVYPEGTRYTPAKLAKLKARTDIEDPTFRALVDELQHMLPPRPGGPLALIDEAPHAAVVFCGHVGLDGFHDLKEIWSGALIGATINVRFWRHEPHEIPADPEERATWFNERWLEMDRWVAAQHANRSRSADSDMAVVS